MEKCAVFTLRNLYLEQSRYSRSCVYASCYVSTYVGSVAFYVLYCVSLLSMPIPVAERSKAWVCSHSPAGIAGSNPAEGMAVCLL